MTVHSKQDGDAEVARFLEALVVIYRWRTWSRKNRVAKVGVIECPTCKGRLHLSQAVRNGHLMGQCETANCIRFIE